MLLGCLVRRQIVLPRLGITICPNLVLNLTWYVYFSTLLPLETACALEASPDRVLILFSPR